MSSPLVSVVICAFNEEKFIERCLRSLRDQLTSFDFEVIAVDDGSSDGTQTILSNFSFDKLSVISNSKTEGIGFCSNKGIQTSRGRYVVRVDADDYVSQHFIEVLCVAILENNAAAVQCDYTLVDDQGNSIGSVDSKTHPIACGVIYAKDAITSIGLYNSELRLWEDRELRVRFEKEFKINHLPIPLYRYRQHSGNSSGGWQNSPS